MRALGGGLAQSACELDYGAPLLGTTMVVRQFGVSLVYDVADWSPPDDMWRPYHRWEGVWHREGFDRHVIYVEEGRIIVTQASPAEPDVARALELGRLAVGDGVYPSMYSAAPLAVRIAMMNIGDELVLPIGDVRERRVLPPEEQPSLVSIVGGMDAELRVSATRVRGREHWYSEIFATRVHVGVDGDAIEGNRRVRRALSS
jgi:hypothetical protein